MSKIADLLDRDFSKPVEEVVSVDKADPVTVFDELTEYVVTDHIGAEYERVFSAMAAAVKSPDESVAIWISGSFGSGKSSFAKNLGYVLANHKICGVPASSLFLQHLKSARVAGLIEFLNRTAPCASFMLDVRAEVPAHANLESLLEVMFRKVLRDPEYARDQTELKVDLEKLFEVCEIRSPGKTFAFILDDFGEHLAADSERRKNLRVFVEQFGRISLQRANAGKIPGPAWLVFTSEEKLDQSLQDCFKHQIYLSRANIVEVAARRVLGKKDSGKFLLRNLFREHRASLIQNLTLEHCSRCTDFDEERFVEYYPCLPHLIDLSIDIVAGIRLHPNAPKHLIGGSRTIVKQCFDLLVSHRTRLADRSLGALASIDEIYELLQESLPAQKQRDIHALGERCEEKGYPGMAARVARSLCLMEFAKTDLPSTAKNIAALLIQHVTQAPPTLAVATILDRMRGLHFARETEHGWKLYDFDELNRAAGALEGLGNAVGKVNPRHPGWHNGLIQSVKKVLARALIWYTRPLSEFNASVTRSLEQIVVVLDRIVALDDLSTVALDDLSVDVVVLRTRLAQSEKKSTTLQRQLDLLQKQVDTLIGLQKAGALPPSVARMRTDRNKQLSENSRFNIDAGVSNDRTAYVLGLFGTGRLYVCELIQQNMGERARHFRDAIRFHPGPTPMIYSGHATVRHVSRAQNLPAVTSRIFEAVSVGFADLIFIYRHPLDSLLTNWIWWRTHIRDYSCISGISQIYANREDLCADLERNFLEFKAFAEGDPEFFAHAAPGRRFLSFEEFVEETELFLQSPATLKLRLEDFMVDPFKEFSRIGEIMSVDVDLRGLPIAPPRSKPYGYMAVAGKVPRFKSFIDGLKPETKKRIERIGYNLAT